MQGTGYDPLRVTGPQGGRPFQVALGQMHAIRLNGTGQVGISPDQQPQAPLCRYAPQPPGLLLHLVSAKAAIDHASPPGQARRDLPGPGGADWIGEEQQRRQGGHPRADSRRRPV